MVSIFFCHVGLIASGIGLVYVLVHDAGPWLYGDNRLSGATIAALAALCIALMVVFAFLLSWRQVDHRVKKRMKNAKGHTYFHDARGHRSENRFDFEAFLYELSPARWVFSGCRIFVDRDGCSRVEYKIGPYHYDLCTWLEDQGCGQYLARTQYAKTAPHRQDLPITSVVFDAKSPLIRGIGDNADIRVVREALSLWIKDVRHATADQQNQKRQRKDRHQRRTNDWLLDAWRRSH